MNAPLELNINCQAEISEKLDSFKWSVITRDEALDLLKEIEEEVLSMLVSYLCVHLTQLNA